MMMSPDGGEVAVFDCRGAVQRLWDYLDRELGEPELRAVDAHLAECELCPPHFEFERAFLVAVRSARDERGASTALRGRVRQILGLDPDASFNTAPRGR